VLRKHEVDGCFRVDLVHRELPPVDPFCIGWEFPLMRSRPDLRPDEMKKPRGGRHKARDPRELLEAIYDTTPAAPLSISAWAKAVGIPRQTLTDYLADWHAQGWIATTGEGNSARQYLTEKGRKFLEERS